MKNKSMNNPFPYAEENSIKRYRTYDSYLKQRYGGKVFKVPVDGGFTCPNLDGTKGIGGCTYCGGAYNAGMTGLPIRQQLKAGVDTLHRKWPDAEKYVAYFQSFTNTYAPLPVLREKYEEALSFDGVVGLSVATRADCLPDDVVGYLRELNGRTDLCVELGLQTVHDRTAERINRCHTMAEFLEGYRKLEGVPVCVHLINGLPGETKEDMLETAKTVAALRPFAVKLHLLYIIEGTEMARLYRSGGVEPMTREDYTDVVVRQLELFPPETVIERITGDGKGEELLAPDWSRRKFVVMNGIDHAFLERDTWQGRLWNAGA